MPYRSTNVVLLQKKPLSSFLLFQFLFLITFELANKYLVTVHGVDPGLRHADCCWFQS